MAAALATTSFSIVYVVLAKVVTDAVVTQVGLTS